jgi:CRP-like cAMP-binding protein
MANHEHLHDAPASRLAMLRKLALFANLSEAELRQVDASTCELDIAPGTVFVKQGQVGREAFVVTAGVADVSVDGVSIAQLGPGEPIGEMALLDGTPRSATVTALTPLRVLVMDRGQFAELASYPLIAGNLLEVESRRRGAARLGLVTAPGRDR